MNIIDYFKNSDDKNSAFSSKLATGPFFDKTVKDFYNNCIKKEFANIKPFIKNWDNFLNQYVNLDVPIFWIRKYESVGDKLNGRQNNRRGCLTLVVNNNVVKFAYAFISNYDAQEFYNMIRAGVVAPSTNDFIKMMENGEYQFHYHPEGKDCQDNLISFFDNRGNISSGILNKQKWYLAHIVDVNGLNYENQYNLTNAEINEIFFSRGDVKEWKNVNSIADFINFKFNRNKNNKGLDRMVRIQNIQEIYDNFKKKKPNVSDNDIDLFYKNLLKAHFLRFVHPLNYFLVPSKECEVNGIYGKKKISIGEYKPLTKYIRAQLILDLQIQNMILKLDKNMMLPCSIIQNNTTNLKYENYNIYINYGAKYNEYIFLDDEQVVGVPKQYNNIEDFIDFINSLNPVPSLTVFYSIRNINANFKFSPRFFSQEKIKRKILNDLANRGLGNISIKELDYISVEICNVGKKK